MQQPQQQQQFVNMGGPYNMGYTVAPPTAWTAPIRPSKVDAFKHRQAISLGSMLVCVGALSVIFNIVDLGLLASLYFTYGVVGHGIWTGVIAITAGGVGIGAGKGKQRCTIHAFNVLCVITASLTIGELVAGVMGATITAKGYMCNLNSYYYYGSNYYYYGYYGTTPMSMICQTSIAMEALMAIMAVITAGAAIWGSVICCKAACCCSCTDGPTMPYIVQYSATQMPMTVISTAQGQQLVPMQFASYPVPQQVGQPQWMPAPPQYAVPAVPAFQPPAYANAPATTPASGAVGGGMQQPVGQQQWIAAPSMFAAPAVPAFQPPAYTNAPATTPAAGAVGAGSGMEHLQQPVDQKTVA